MTRITIPVLFLLLALALAACGGEETAAEQLITLTAADIEYGTEQIEVTAGVPVVLTLENEGALDHDFSIVDIPLSGEVSGMEDEEMDDHEMTMDEEELDLHLSAHAGESATITFTPSEPGEYRYFCTVPGHEESGMVGTLVVEAP
jgi:uncharacterized cupredoxin-like copper-binding protein